MNIEDDEDMYVMDRSRLREVPRDHYIPPESHHMKVKMCGDNMAHIIFFTEEDRALCQATFTLGDLEQITALVRGQQS